MPPTYQYFWHVLTAFSGRARRADNWEQRDAQDCVHICHQSPIECLKYQRVWREFVLWSRVARAAKPDLTADVKQKLLGLWQLTPRPSSAEAGRIAHVEPRCARRWFENFASGDFSLGSAVRNAAAGHVSSAGPL